MAHVIHTDSKAEWLEARRSIITATDMQKLHSTKTRACWEQVRNSKQGVKDSFTGNVFTEWGNRREPHIAQWAKVFIDDRLEWNEEGEDRYQDIYVSDDNELWGCTPDMIGPGVCCQIKTSQDVVPDRYQVQCQWEKLVTGVEYHWLVIEPRLQGAAGFEPGTPEFWPVILTDEQAEALKQTAREFEAFWLHGTLPPWMGGEEVPEELPGLLARYGELLEVQQELDAEMKPLKEQIKALAPEGTTEVDGWQIQLVQPKPRKTFDTRGFKKDHADLAAQYMKESPSAVRMTIKEVA